MAISNKTVNNILTISRTLDAPRDLVFKAWTDPEMCAHWWGPDNYTTPHCKIDLRVGGKTHFCMRSPEGQDFWCGGVYKEIIVPSKIVITDYFADEEGNPVSPTKYGLPSDFPEEALITVIFEDLRGRTRFTLYHTIPSMDDAKIGWNQSFDRLAAYLAKL